MSIYQKFNEKYLSVVDFSVLIYMKNTYLNTNPFRIFFIGTGLSGLSKTRTFQNVQRGAYIIGRQYAVYQSAWTIFANKNEDFQKIKSYQISPGPGMDTAFE